MKRLLTLLIAIITLVSCDEFINFIAPNDYINVEPTNELHFLSSESSIVLTVDSSGEWMVEGITEWCSVTPESGVNGDELTISVTENTLDEERTAELTLRCGVAEIIISVVQEKMVETDYVDMDFDSEGTATQYNASTGIVSITYSNGNIPNVEVGKAIVLPADYKFDIRVVESVSKSDNTLTLETSQGSMCNLFRNTSFTLSTNENTRSVDANGQPIITPVAIGYYDVNGKYIETYNQLKPSTLSTHTISTALWSFNMNWNGATLYEGKGGRLWWEKCAFDAGLNGVFNFDFGEQPGGILGKVGELEEFSYTLQGSIGADLLMRYYYENSATFNDDRILEYNVIPTKVYKFVVNGVYVYILVNTHLGQYVEFGAEGYVGVSGGVKLGLDVEAGLKWSKAYGVEVIKSATPHIDIYHPTIKAEASAYAKFSYYPQVEIGLYGFIGPFVEPRPYVKEKVSAGFRASTDGENYVAFKDEYFSGLDMRIGLKLDFGLLDWEWKSNVFNVVDDTLLVTSPSRITQTSPSSSNVKIEEGESINATFKVESYSPVTGKYWPCEGAAVVFESESGELSKSLALTDASGMVDLTWTPAKSTHPNSKSSSLKAIVYNVDGSIIDEAELVVQFHDINIELDAYEIIDQPLYQDVDVSFNINVYIDGNENELEHCCEYGYYIKCADDYVTYYPVNGIGKYQNKLLIPETLFTEQTVNYATFEARPVVNYYIGAYTVQDDGKILHTDEQIIEDLVYKTKPTLTISNLIETEEYYDTNDIIWYVQNYSYDEVISGCFFIKEIYQRVEIEERWSFLGETGIDYRNDVSQLTYTNTDESIRTRNIWLRYKPSVLAVTVKASHYAVLKNGETYEFDQGFTVQK